MILYYFLVLLMFCLVLLPFGNYFFVFVNSFFFCLGLNLGFIEVFFLLSLCFIVLNIFLYSYYYLSSESSFFYFMNIVFIFVLSMIFLISHSSGLVFMLGWDGLGISSYLLIKFYNNWSSINGGFVTVMTNRLGDVGLFWLFSFFFFFFNLNSSSCLHPLFLFIFILFCFTKSAQAPFSSWLPMAMSAPTPVSSLVHSSTLVTAGIFVLMKYYFLLCSSGLMFFLWCFGGFTMFVSGVMALVEMDSKKVIALSTLSQLGFLVMGLGCGYKFLVFFHLLSHAFFKSCLFMQMGVFIHSLQSAQDSRVYSKGFFLSFSSFTIFLVCLISLCGLCFMSGFISKDFLIMWEVGMGFSFFMGLVVFFSLLFTFIYSYRLLISVLKVGRFSFFFFNSSYLIILSGGGLALLGVIFGWWFIYNMSFTPLVINSGEKVFPLLVLSNFFFFIVFSYSFFLGFSGMCFQDSFLFVSKKVFFFLPNKVNMLMDFFFLFFYSVFFRYSSGVLFFQKGGFGGLYFLVIYFIFMIFFF